MVWHMSSVFQEVFSTTEPCGISVSFTLFPWLYPLRKDWTRAIFHWIPARTHSGPHDDFRLPGALVTHPSQDFAARLPAKANCETLRRVHGTCGRVSCLACLPGHTETNDTFDECLWSNKNVLFRFEVFN